MKRYLNLIPVATQRRHTLRRMVRIGSRSIVAAGLITGSLLAVEWARGLSSLRALGELEARYAPLSRLLHEHADLTDKITKLRGREQLSLRLSRDHYGLAVLGAIATAAGDSAGSVYVQELEYNAAALTNSDRPNASRSLQLAGAGVDGIAVAGFAERLRESGVFSEVAVESTSPMAGGPPSLRKFEIACAL